MNVSRRLDVVTPVGADAVEVVFAPTRTRILAVVATGITTTATELADAAPAFTLRFEPTRLPTVATLVVFWKGEAPRRESIRWSQPEPVLLFNARGRRIPRGVTASDANEGIYRARERRKGLRGDDSVFMWELERLTNSAFWEHAGLTPDEIRKRGQALWPLLEAVGTRLRARWHGQPIPETVGRDPVEVFSGIFRQAAKVLDGDLRRVGKALELFSAGGMRQEFANPNDASLHETEAEPDSYFIFYFAEFALLARDLGVDPEFWTDRLLKSLVKMQRIYVHRWINSGVPQRTDPWCVVHLDGEYIPYPWRYRNKAVSFRTMLGLIDLQYSLIRAKREALEDEMHANLKLASRTCFDGRTRA